MQKLTFAPASDGQPAEFYVVAETILGGRNYLLVSDVDPSGDEDGEALILRDDSEEGSEDGVYSMIDDDREFDAVSKLFRDILDEEDIDLEEDET